MRPGRWTTTVLELFWRRAMQTSFLTTVSRTAFLPIVLPRKTVDELFAAVVANEGYTLEVDLDQQTLCRPNASDIAFEVDSFRKHCLLNGLDDIGITLEDAELITAFESRWREKAPWYFAQSGIGAAENTEASGE